MAKKKTMGEEKPLFAHLGQMCRNHGLLYGDGIIMLNPEDQFGFKGAMKGKSDLNYGHARTKARTRRASWRFRKAAGPIQQQDKKDTQRLSYAAAQLPPPPAPIPGRTPSSKSTSTKDRAAHLLPAEAAWLPCHPCYLTHAFFWALVSARYRLPSSYYAISLHFCFV